MSQKKLSRRDFLRAGAFAVGGAALAGCRPPAESEPVVEREVETVVETRIVREEVEVEVTAKAPEMEPVEIRFAWWGSQDRHTRTIGMIKLFEQTYPYITVKYEPAGWTDHWTKLSTQAAGGNLPDLMQQDYARIEEWVENDLLLAIDEYVSDGIIDLSDVPQASIDGGIVDGRLWGVNVGNNSQCWSLDVDLFAKAGVDLPAQDWSWDDFEEIATALHDNLGIWGMGDGISGEQTWKSLYLGYGQWGYSDDGKSLGYTDDQPLIDLFKMIMRLQDAGVIPSREEELATFEPQGVEAKATVSGAAVMDYFWSNQLVAVWTAAGVSDRNFVLTHIPRPADGCCSSNYVKPSQFLSVTAHANYPKEAAMLADFYTNSEEANEILMGERGVPITGHVKEHLKPLLDTPNVEIFEFLSRIEADCSPVPPADPAAHAEIVNNVYFPRFVDPVRFGQISPEEGVATFREEATAILEAAS
jgi:multiple sugar transport system substrate-binding protein